MTQQQARTEVLALRHKLEEELNTKRTHFSLHLTYIDAYDELEKLALKIARQLEKGEKEWRQPTDCTSQGRATRRAKSTSNQ